MKVLHICYTDNIGGAAKAALRIHYALRKGDVESYMLVYKRTINDPYIIQMSSFLEKLYAFMGYHYQKISIKFYKNRKGNDFSTMCFPDKLLLRRIDQINPDLVHIHYLGPGIISIKGISKIKQKIVWTLHDSFIFTGGCHTPGTCQRYKDSCGSCEYLNSTKYNDISKINWLKKEKYLSTCSNIFFTAPSSWMRDCVESSSLFNDKSIECIPNLIDNTVFSPNSTEISKIKLNKDPNFKVITSGGSNFDLDHNKGMDYFLGSLKFLNYRADDIEIFIFGTSKKEIIKINNYNIHLLGYISNQEEIIKLLSASDVVVIPSRQESFGQIAIEAMACGTPVVAFDTSGLKDIIEHKVDGYLAEPFKVEDLANGIRYLLVNDLSKEVTKTVEKKFSEKVILKKVMLFYQKILFNV